MKKSMNLLAVSLLTILLGFTVIQYSPAFAEDHDADSEVKDHMDDAMDDAEDSMDDAMDDAEDSMDDAMDDAEDSMDNAMDDKRQDIKDAMKEQRDQMKDQMKERTDAMKDDWKEHDKMGDHMMATEEFKAKIMDKISNYCGMTDQEREKYDMEHAKEMAHMSEEMKQAHAEMCAMSEDERSQYLDDHPELVQEARKMMQHKMNYRMMGVHSEYHEKSMEKFRAMHSDLSEEKIMEMKEKMNTKYSAHMDKLSDKYHSMSDVKKHDWMTKYESMKQHVENSGTRYNEMTDEEKAQYKQNLKDELRMKYKDWLSPRKQMQMGISSDEIICKEGLESITRNSNGAVLCVHPTTASKMIERGFAIPSL